MHYIGHEVSNMPIFIGNDMLFSACILIIITSVMLLHDTCKESLKSHLKLHCVCDNVWGFFCILNFEFSKLMNRSLSYYVFTSVL